MDECNCKCCRIWREKAAGLELAAGYKLNKQLRARVELLEGLLRDAHTDVMDCPELHSKSLLDRIDAALGEVGMKPKQKETEMGMVSITMKGSFPYKEKTFSAMKHGHAAAVSEAIAWLSKDILPKAIRQDHDLHERGEKPAERFGHGE